MLGSAFFAAVAIALDHILAWDGGVGGTLTVARSASGFDFVRTPREPAYVRFEKGEAETPIDMLRYPDDERADARSWPTDFGLIRAARRIQARAADPPVEILHALESDRLTADPGIGVEIRDETTLGELYR